MPPSGSFAGASGFHDLPTFVPSELSSEGLSGLSNDGVKAGWVMDRHFGQSLAIQLDASLGQAVDEFAVFHPAIADGRIDTNDPQATELTLAIAAVAKGVYAGSNDRFLGLAEQRAFRSAIAFCSAE
jgi:hypothetical protein